MILYFSLHLIFFQFSLFFLLFIIQQEIQGNQLFFLPLLCCPTNNQAWNSTFLFLEYITLFWVELHHKLVVWLHALFLIFGWKNRRVNVNGWHYHIISFSCVISGFYTPGNSKNLYVPFCFQVSTGIYRQYQTDLPTYQFGIF